MKKNMKRLLAGILVYVIIAAGVLPVLAEEAGRITPDESVSEIGRASCRERV